MTNKAVGCQLSAVGRLLLLLAVGCGFAVCAKKMLPPSPDRFPPHLELVRTRNRVRLELVFDEDIDATKLCADSFAVTGPADQPIPIRGAVAGRRSSSVELWTVPQEPVLYRVRGTVIDIAGNAGRFATRFRGSDRPDTIAPRVTRILPEPGSAGRRRPAVRVEFSEPVDTTGAASYFFVPQRWDSAYQPGWAADWQTLMLQDTGFGADETQRHQGTDSMESGKRTAGSGNSGVVYFMLMPGVRDLEGNRSRQPAFTYFTPDSALEAVPVHGQVKLEHGPLGTGVVFFGAEKNPGLAPILSDGSFATRVRAGEYQVRAVSDTNADRLADLASRLFGFNTQEESLELLLEPESMPRPLEDYRSR